jgi:hypothetical protein
MYQIWSQGIVEDSTTEYMATGNQNKPRRPIVSFTYFEMQTFAEKLPSVLLSIPTLVISKAPSALMPRRWHSGPKVPNLHHPRIASKP